MRLENKSAVVTGAGSGIGRSIAELFAAEGARVAVLDIRAEPAQETVELLDPILARAGLPEPTVA